MIGGWEHDFIVYHSCAVRIHCGAVENVKLNISPHKPRKPSGAFSRAGGVFIWVWAFCPLWGFLWGCGWCLSSWVRSATAYTRTKHPNGGQTHPGGAGEAVPETAPPEGDTKPPPGAQGVV